MTSATAIALGAAIIGAASSLTGALISVWAQHRLLMKQFRLLREEDERKRQLAALEREEAERRAEKDERNLLIRRISDLSFPKANPIGKLLSENGLHHWLLGDDEFALREISTSMLRQIVLLSLTDANADAERAELREATDLLKQVLGEAASKIAREHPAVKPGQKSD